jgi:hypothetical protein
MTEPTPPTWPHEPVALGWVRTPSGAYYQWCSVSERWRMVAGLPNTILELLECLRAALDAERQRAEQAERERDELRAIMKAGHTRKACVGREPVYSMRCSACKARSRAEAAERQARELKAALLPCMQALPTIGRYVALRKQAKAALEATASPEPSVTEGRRE